MDDFDVIVVGAGSSGGVIASRLSEDDSCRVLLLEGGPDFPEEETLPPLFAVSGGHRWIPAGIPEMDWGLWNEPQANGHQVRLARGKLVGGSSMVNGTVAVRGAPFDYDRWASLGNPGWSWDDVLPYFCRLENDADFGDEPYHGTGGPIHVRRFDRSAWSPIHEAFVDGCLEAGLRDAPDLNAPDASAGCVGAWPQNRLNEVRLGTLTTYIRAARRRPNFELHADALVDRILFDGDRATGVRYISDTGEPVEAHAGLVIVAAGAYLTPTVLQRSGIGPAEVLRRAGVEPRIDLPVGRNLSDHPNAVMAIQAEALSPTTGRIFLTNCRGPAVNGPEPSWQALAVPVDEATGLSAIVICLNRQDALGYVEITGPDPGRSPRIDHRYNTCEADFARFEEGFAFCRELLRTRPFTAVGATEVTAGRSVRDIVMTGVGTAQHPVGTCRMGPAGDGTTVVDHRLRVHGVEGLMVADSSVFPDNTMNNTNLTCYMIGEKAADLARGRAADTEPSADSVRVEHTLEPEEARDANAVR